MNLAQLKIDALSGFAAIRKCHDKMKSALVKHGYASKQYQKLLEEVSTIPGHPLHRPPGGQLSDSRAFNVEEVRVHERVIGHRREQVRYALYPLHQDLPRSGRRPRLIANELYRQRL